MSGGVILTSAILHAASNIDNLVMLTLTVGMMGWARAVAAWFAAQALVLGTAMLLASAAEWTVAGHLGLLGAVPLFLGIRGLWTWCRFPYDPVCDPGLMGPRRAVIVFLSMSADTLVLFAALLADTAEGLEAQVLVGAALSVLLLALATRLLGKRFTLPKGWAAVAPSLAMIVAGIYVLLDTFTD